MIPDGKWFESKQIILIDLIDFNKCYDFKILPH